MANDPWGAGIDIGNQVLGDILGFNLGSYQNVRGPSVQEFTSRWTGDLGNLKGYYDESRVGGLTAALGSTTSGTYLNQLSALATEANKVYTYIQNPNSVTSSLNSYLDRTGKDMVQIGFGGFRRDKRQGSWFYDAMGNRSDVLMSPVMSQLYQMVDTIKANQDTISQQLGAQQQKENSFVTQINQITQQATLAKTKAEQEAAAKALQTQYQQQQAALDKQAQANQSKLAEQQKQQAAELAAQKLKQEQDFAAAKAKADEAARQQQLTLNKSAQTQALSTVANSKLEQAKLQVSQQEAQASQTRGGEATVSTNAAPAKTQKGVSTRTERWQATRQPAAGGGGIRA